MTAHTKGPWQVDAPFPVVTGIKDGRPVVIADAQYRNNEHPGAMVMQNEGMANARLIAAAPDLLAALEECLTDDGATAERSHTMALKRLVAINEIARAAIAKARG